MIRSINSEEALTCKGDYDRIIASIDWNKFYESLNNNAEVAQLMDFLLLNGPRLKPDAVVTSYESLKTSQNARPIDETNKPEFINDISIVPKESMVIPSK